MIMIRGGLACRVLGSALVGVLTGAVLLMPMGPTVSYGILAGDQRAHDSECGDRCWEDTADQRASLVCDSDGTWWAWLLAGQSVHIPAGRCDRSSSVPSVFGADGVEVGADVSFVDDSIAGLGEAHGL